MHAYMCACVCLCVCVSVYISLLFSLESLVLKEIRRYIIKFLSGKTREIRKELAMKLERLKE